MKFMKNPIKKLTPVSILIAALYFGAAAQAADFNLSSVSAYDLRGIGFDTAPAPRPQAAEPAPDRLVDVDFSINVSFKAIKKAVVTLAASDKLVSVIDPAAPVLERSGESLKVVNIRIDLDGIIVEPVITLKPYFEGKDRIAVRVQRVQLHAGMSPSSNLKGNLAAAPEFNKEDMMAEIINFLTGSLLNAFNASLIENQSPLKASDIVGFKYDKAAWTLHAVFSNTALKYYLPEWLVGDIHMTGFSLRDSGIDIRFGKEK